MLRSTLLLLLLGSLVYAFAPPSLTQNRLPQQQQDVSSSLIGKPIQSKTTSCISSPVGSSTQLYSFMGSDGGLLGVGTPELFTIVLVGYFVLGPSDLYKAVKEIGKFVRNIQTFSQEATSTIENNLESQLQVEEIRKAQRELNDAFNFRRSINVDTESEAFSTNAQSDRVGVREGETATDPAAVAEAATASATAATAAPTTGKKKIRRRRKKKVVAEDEAADPALTNLEAVQQQPLANNVPDLDMGDEPMSEAEAKAMKSMQEANERLRQERDEEEAAAAAAKRRAERIERLGGPSAEDALAEQEMAMMSGYDPAVMNPTDEQSRFQAQLSNTWNEQILAKDEELEPMAKLMKQLALLEEEKNANDARLQEEFRAREENEERFYKEKRKLLEEAAAKFQAEAYATGDGASKASSNTTTATK